MSSSSRAWLPPLNVHENFDIIVEVDQERHLEVDKRPPGTEPTLLEITLHVCVTYRPDFPHQLINSFGGLDFYKDVLFPLDIPVTSGDLTMLVRYGLLQPFVQFHIEQVIYKEHTMLPLERYRDTVSLSTDDFVTRLADFLKNLVENAPMVGLAKVRASVEIRKCIVIPRIEFNEWNKWYNERNASDPDFAHNFRESNSRLRTLEELLAEGMLLNYKPTPDSMIEQILERVLGMDPEFKNCSCAVCMDDLRNKGGVVLSRIKCCSNVFHEECIVRWLKTSHKCPLCNYKFPTEI